MSRAFRGFLSKSNTYVYYIEMNLVAFVSFGVGTSNFKYWFEKYIKLMTYEIDEVCAEA